MTTMATKPTKSLFSLASEAARRTAQRAFSRSPIGRLATQARRKFTGRGAARRLQKIAETMADREVQKLLKEMGDAGGPMRYSLKDSARGAMDKLLKSLGPLGGVIRSIVGAGNNRSFTDNQFDAAADFIRAMGGEVLTPKGGKGHGRGVDAAKTLLESLGYGVTAPGKGSRPAADEWPAEHDIQILPEGGAGSAGPRQGDWDWRHTIPPPLPGERDIVSSEILTPGSSNVYSYRYVRESRKSGILFVTFKAWAPGKGRMKTRGPMYAYYDVPVKRYLEFKATAGHTAGGAVWDYLRIRGTASGHQYPYRLVQGAVIPEIPGGVYIPRKVTPRGFRTRNLPVAGTGRRAFRRSTLLESVRPDRGTPNRGRP